MVRSTKLACVAAVALLGTSATALPAKAQNHFIGEVIFMATNFCPAGTLPTDGRLLPIAQYTALFALNGTMYGGDGRTNFAIPKITRIPTQDPDSPLMACIVADGAFPARP
ncbi:MAG TPA: phage tail protein [Xanthobacteraceae bacterium]|jgi:microcystin-dependent protein|nr:phage tail protein [Xanthobacteraceae bacterium]